MLSLISFCFRVGEQGPPTLRQGAAIEVPRRYVLTTAPINRIDDRQRCEYEMRGVSRKGEAEDLREA